MRAVARATGRAALALVIAVLAVPGWSHADPSAPAVEQRRQPPPETDARSEYDRGVRARVARNWPDAVDAFHRAVTLRPKFPEAWNEFGYALRNQGRYEEALDAYGEALKLRPDFPEALEYLGETYVKMGRLDDAHRILDRLRPLDAGRARELAEVIATAR